MSLSLVTLNIERNKHLGKVVPFLKERMYDVVCLQEVYEEDTARIAADLGATYQFSTRLRTIVNGNAWKEGTAILSRVPVRSFDTIWYAGLTTEEPPIDPDAWIRFQFHTQRFVIVTATIEKDGDTFRIATTHFPGSKGGEADDIQRESLKLLLEKAASLGEMVLCGDFNAPRGKEIFSALTETYTDNVPHEYTTSIDGEFHRVGPLPYMVDGIFSTKGYKVHDVDMVCGLSDHCALTALVDKA